MNTALLIDNTDLVLILAPIIGGLFCIGLFVWWFLTQYPKEKEKRLQKQRQLFENCEKEPEYAFTQAKVLLKKKGGYYQSELSMPALPKWIDEQTVVFQTENGEEVEYPVRLEVFVRLEEGQEGTLVTVNGNFFDFGDGEDVTEDGTAVDTATGDVTIQDVVDGEYMEETAEEYVEEYAEEMEIQEQWEEIKE